jgi:hypothetical protein
MQAPGQVPPGEGPEPRHDAMLLLQQRDLLPAPDCVLGPRLIPETELQLTTKELGAGATGRVVLGRYRNEEVGKNRAVHAYMHIHTYMCTYDP